MRTFQALTVSAIYNSDGSRTAPQFALAPYQPYPLHLDAASSRTVKSPTFLDQRYPFQVTVLSSLVQYLKIRLDRSLRSKIGQVNMCWTGCDLVHRHDSWYGFMHWIRCVPFLLDRFRRGSLDAPLPRMYVDVEGIATLQAEEGFRDLLLAVLTGDQRCGAWRRQGPI